MKCKAVTKKVLSDGDEDNYLLMDPGIAHIIKNSGRPQGVPQLTSKNIKHFPGKTGLLQGIKSAIALQSIGVNSYLEKKNKFGRVYKDQIGPFPVVVVSDPDEVGKIFRNEDRYWSMGITHDLLTRGIHYNIAAEKRMNPGLLDFEPHRFSRKLMQPAFNSSSMKGYISIIQQSYSEDIREWEIKGKDSMRFKAEIGTILSKPTARLFLGVYDSIETQQVLEATKNCWSAISALSHNPILSPAWRKGLRGGEILAKIVADSIPARKDNDGNDLLSRFCKIQKETGKLDDEQITDMILAINFGAFDTVAHGLSSMAYLLAIHPEWQERLREEMFSFTNVNELSDLQAMNVTDCFWKETLRLYPVAPSIMRYSLRDYKLGEYTIPAGTVVVLSNGPGNVDPDLWSDPDQFDPERFSPERAEDKRNRYQYMPYGQGDHICIGMHLAIMEVKLFWHALLKRYRIRLAKPYKGIHQLRPLGTISGSVDLNLEVL